MSLSWVACEARTGRVLAELPDLACQEVRTTMGRYESASAALPLPTAPEIWERVVLEAATWFVLLDDDRPVWGGFSVESTRSHADVVDLELATPEAYLTRRYVGDRTYTGVGQNAIVVDLVTAFVADADGIPLSVVTSGADTPRTRTYTDASGQTVYSQMQELMGVSGGPEWTVRWQHLSAPERYVPVLHVGALGSTPAVGMDPAATFTMPGPVGSVEMRRSFADGLGANAVRATSSTTATGVTPSSPLQVAADAQRPRMEYRWSPSSSITDVSTLTAHAQRALASMSDGAVTLAMTVDLFTGPRLGAEWDVGDVVGFQIGGVDGSGRQTVPAFPGGFSGRARVLGWSLSLTETPRVVPTLEVI